MDGDALYEGGCIQLLHLCAFIAEKNNNVNRIICKSI